MSEPGDVFNSILRTREGAIFGLNVKNNFFSMKTPKITLTITNPPDKEKQDGKARYAKVFLDPVEVIEFIRKLQQGVRNNLAGQNNRAELYKIYKGGPDKKRRFGVDIVSRIFSVTADKGRIFLKIEISVGKQMQTKNKLGQSVPGVVKPAGGPPLESVSFALNNDSAMNLAYSLDKEYAGWRAALNYDMLVNPSKYTYHSSTSHHEQSAHSYAQEEPPAPSVIF